MRIGPLLVGLFFTFLAFSLFKDGEGGAGLMCLFIGLCGFGASKKEWKYKGSVDVYRKE